MKRNRWSSQRSISLARLEATPIDRPATFAGTWTLKCGSLSDDAILWNLTVTESDVELTIGRARIKELRDAIENIKAGQGDYCIGPDDAPLWIWVEVCWVP